MIVTQRDRDLFHKLASYGMLSTKQANTLIFNTIASTTVLRRLRILEEHHYLKRITGLDSHEVLWVLTEKAATTICVLVPKKSWSKNILKHDFKLLSLRLKLESTRVAQSWIPEHEIHSLVYKKFGLREGKQRLIPDGLMGTVAIELELTLKNQRRIKETVDRYHEKKELTAVWYIASTQTILNSVFREWRKHKRVNSSLKLYGSLLEDVLADPLEATVFREDHPCKVKELWRSSAAHFPAHEVSIPRRIN